MKKRVLAMMLSTMLFLSACGNQEEAARDLLAGQETITQETGQGQEEGTPDSEPGASAGPADGETAEAMKTVDDQEKKPSAGEAKATASPQPTETAKPQTSPSPSASPTSASGTGKKETSPTASKAPASNPAPASSTPAPEAKPTEAPHTSCSWDGGSVTKAASCSSEGTRTYTCTVCGKTRSEGIARTGHNLVTESKAATCDAAGSTKSYCSSCGYVESETANGSALGHHWNKVYWPSEPTCTSGGTYNIACDRCGANDGHGTDPALGHSTVYTEIAHGNCTDETVLVGTCERCGTEVDRQGHTEPGDHDWEEITDVIYDPVTHSDVEIKVTRCSRCGVQPAS